MLIFITAYIITQLNLFCNTHNIILHKNYKMVKRKIDPNKPKIKLPIGQSYIQVKNLVHKNKLNTICESGNCPNMHECWGAGTATFLILGDICTRSCRFCSVKTGKPYSPDLNEPKKIAESVKLMNLKHCVITSVDRDDLADGGSNIWAETINEIKKLNPNTTIETLIPDFKGNFTLLQTVINAKPNVISHNLETVKRLTKQIRVQAKYDRSLSVLKYIAEQGITAKSGIMLGLGETNEEIYDTMDDLLKNNVSIITIGQYLQPTKDNIPVQKYYSEDEFKALAKIGKNKGFKFIESSSLVRSSYHAEKHV